jgi:hypothetical protein
MTLLLTTRIEFDIRLMPAPLDEPDAREYYVLDIVVDGRNLLEFLRDAEMPFAVAEGHPDLAGKYEALPAHLLLPKLGGKQADKISLYDCECGCFGCWPLLVRILLADEIVTWSEFEQPHRGQRSRASWWRYEGLGPFTFSRKQYEEALAKASAELGQIGIASPLPEE